MFSVRMWNVSTESPELSIGICEKFHCSRVFYKCTHDVYRTFRDILKGMADVYRTFLEFVTDTGKLFPESLKLFTGTRQFLRESSELSTGTRGFLTGTTELSRTFYDKYRRIPVFLRYTRENHRGTRES